jgi:hypothetical protein
VKKVKNNKEILDVWVSQEIQPGQYYVLEEFEEDRWSINPKVEEDVINGNLVVNDGTGDLSSGDGLNLIKNKTRYVGPCEFSINTTVTLGVFTIVGTRIVFRGQNYVGMPYKIKMLASTTSSSASVRIYDVTNAKVICQKTDITGNASQIFDMGSITNIPSREAIWEVQAKINGAIGGITVESMILYF